MNAVEMDENKDKVTGMKRECPVCGKVVEFGYWETEKVHREYRLDSQGYVYFSDQLMEEEEYPEHLSSYLQCSDCGARFVANKEPCNKTTADARVSLGPVK